MKCQKASPCLRAGHIRQERGCRTADFRNGCYLSGTASDLTKTFSYNPASQIVTETRSNDAYAQVLANATQTTVTNGLNQLTQYAGQTVTHETRGNLNGYGSDIYTYSNENLMTGSVVGGVGTGLKSDPLLRLYEVASGPVSRFAYDGLDGVAEYDSLNALQRRWVFDPTTDQPVIWYEGTGTAATDRRYLSQDERGSVISVSDSTGAALGVNTYDEYGNPAAGNVGRYGYTGQAWLPTAKLWYLNARMYSPAIGGRFLQTDPIGMAGGINLYNYTGNNPVNQTDPLGLSFDQSLGAQPAVNCIENCIGPAIIVIGQRIVDPWLHDFGKGGFLNGIGGLAQKLVDRGGGAGGGKGQKPQTRKLPRCAVAFLRGRIAVDPRSITLHEGGSVINLTGNSVTYGSDIYLSSGASLFTQFHEIWHASQNASMGLNSFDHFAAYLAFGSHDASPLEQAADKFAADALTDFKAAGLDKSCKL